MNRIEELIKTINVRMAELDGLKKRVADEKRKPTEVELAQMEGYMKELYGEKMDRSGGLMKELDLERVEAAIRNGLSTDFSDRVVRPQMGDNEDKLQKRFGTFMPAQEKRFASLGEQFNAVRAAHSGSYRDNRLGFLEDQLRASGLSEGVPADGGFLVQTDISFALLQKVYEMNPILPRISKFTLTTNSNAIELPTVNETTRSGSIWGGIVFYWLDEGIEKTKSAPKFKKISLKLKKVAGLCYGTDELTEDVSILSQILEKGFTEGLDKTLGTVLISGSGAGQPLGILNSGCKIAVAAETGQLPSTILAENIVNMYSRMWSGGIRNSIWLYNQSIIPQLMFLTMPGIPTIPLYMPPTGLAGAPYGTLLGRPTYPIEAASVLGTEGDLMYCDFSQYAAIDKGNPKWDFSPHVRFIYDEGTWRMVYRFDGQPIWAQTLTCADGTTTVSPFITLETR